jgi:hypothetical protein
MALKPDDIVPLEVDRAKLGRALCKAFGFNSRASDLGVTNTIQIGSYSADAVPVILSLQIERYTFQRVVAQLVANLNKPFILLAPTADHLDANCLSLLARVKAEFFPLDSTVLVTEQGILLPARTPGEIFARFRPEPKDSMPEDTARQLLALIQKFDRDTLLVFRKYCVEGMTVIETSRNCSCSRATTYRRLNQIHATTGMHPNQLRQLSPFLGKIEDQLSDSRAARIYRKSAIYDHDDPDTT